MKTKVQTRKNKRNYLIIALIVVLLLLAVGYASFSETLNISGTAKGDITWDVKFTSASTGSVSSDGHTLTVTTNDLKFPGDAKEITAVIQNNSSVDVKLTDFQVVAPADDKDITIKKVDLTDDDDEVLKANGGLCTYKYVIEWDEDSEQESVEAEYSFQFTYTQDTTKVEFTPTHDEAKHNGSN